MPVGCACPMHVVILDFLVEWALSSFVTNTYDVLSVIDRSTVIDTVIDKIYCITIYYYLESGDRKWK